MGHVILYFPSSDCHGLGMQRMLSDVLLIQYLRLIQIIMIVLLILICCPLMLVCGRFRRSRPVAADTVSSLFLILS